ncbi:hypothetical protein A7I15_06710 [Staphylococcus epidermidis]|nr:hypothetical protein A7I15_06710 [Staphylococcus epidermidis]
MAHFLDIFNRRCLFLFVGIFYFYFLFKNFSKMLFCRMTVSIMIGIIINMEKYYPEEMLWIFPIFFKI